MSTKMLLSSLLLLLLFAFACLFHLASSKKTTPVSLHPLGSLDQQVHLLGLLVALLFHDGEDLVTLLALLQSLLVLILDQGQLMVSLVELGCRRVLLPCLILHFYVVRV
jgi:hypothetical protein